MCPEKIDGIVTLLSDFSGLIALRGINFTADLRLHVASKQSRHSEQLYICAGVPVSAAAVSRLPAFPFKHTNSLGSQLCLSPHRTTDLPKRQLQRSQNLPPGCSWRGILPIEQLSLLARLSSIVEPMRMPAGGAATANECGVFTGQTTSHNPWNKHQTTSCKMRCFQVV